MKIDKDVIEYIRLEKKKKKMLKKTMLKNINKNVSNQLNICAIIPTYKKPEKIVLKTIEHLQKQTVPLSRVVVVGSCEEDSFLKKASVDYIEVENLPLYNKFQAGVTYCKQFNPDAILICGADDWLSLNWIETLIPFLKTYDVVGSNHLYAMSFIPGTPLCINCVSYQFNIKRSLESMGPGRLISKDLLEKMSWNVFVKVIKLNKKGKQIVVNEWRNIDGTSFQRMCEFGCNSFTYKEDNIKILSPKGPWKCLSNLDRLGRERDMLIRAKHPPIDNPEQWLNHNFPGALQYLCESLNLKLVKGVLTNV